MSHNFLTLHILTALPFHNVNRDELGRPKQVSEGGVDRARISSQAQKRAARNRFEASQSALKSVRSRQVVSNVVAAALALNPKLDIVKAELDASVAVLLLTNNSEKAAKEAAVKAQKTAGQIAGFQRTIDNPATDTAKREKAEADLAAFNEKNEAAAVAALEKNPLVWLSETEIGALVKLIAAGVAPKPFDYISTATVNGETTQMKNMTDSLAIAFFGRMFAFASDLQNEAAVAVSHATTTHEASIEIDYFSAVDDLDSRGAGHLGQNFFTSGVYSRSFTIDRRQLHATWTGLLDIDTESANEQLREAIRALILTTPNGKGSTTAPNTLPAFILAEQQAHRVAYGFHRPVAADEDGYLGASITRLVNEATLAHEFDPDGFGTILVSGLNAADAVTPGWEHGHLDTLIDSIIGWVRDV